jgi:hypothetical protein
MWISADDGLGLLQTLRDKVDAECLSALHILVHGGWQAGIVDVERLHPLLSFNRLTDVELRLATIPTLPDQTMLVLSQAWPQIETLSFGATDVLVSDQAIIAMFRACPRLVFLRAENYFCRRVEIGTSGPTPIADPAHRQKSVDLEASTLLFTWYETAPLGLP